MKKLVIILSSLLLILSGCGKEPLETVQGVTKADLQTLDISGFPVVEIECVKDADFKTQVPEQELITETKGEIIDYIIQDDTVYYIVAYDYYYRDYYEQVAVFKQSIETGKLEQVASTTFEQGVQILSIGYEDELYWYQVSEDDVTYQCTIENEEIVQEESFIDELVDDSWKQGIAKEYLTEKSVLLCETDQYIVWEQWEYEIAETDSLINILNKDTDEIKQFQSTEYGIVKAPVVMGDVMMFLTIDDVKSYSQEGDFYDNVYMMQLDSLEAERITDNYGTEDSLNRKFYDFVRAIDGYCYFISEVVTDGNREYEYLYYLNCEAK